MTDRIDGLRASPFPLAFSDLAISYISVASAALSRARRVAPRYRRSEDLYPIAYMVRHAVELALKGAYYSILLYKGRLPASLRRENRLHSTQYLHDCFAREIADTPYKALLSPREVTRLRLVVRVIDERDGNGVSFRYPAGRAGEPIRFADLDVQRLHKDAAYVIEPLCNLARQIAGERVPLPVRTAGAARADAQAAHATDMRA